MTTPTKVNLADKLAQIREPWRPHVVANSMARKSSW